MKSDSQSMKVIAVVTMLFLPAATVGVRQPTHVRQTSLIEKRAFAVASSLASTMLATRFECRAIFDSFGHQRFP